MGELCRAIDGYIGKGPLVGSALRLLSLSLVRPGEVAKAEWSQIDFENRVWKIPADKTKMRREHQVPLSRQALEALAEIRALNGDRRYVFATYGVRRCQKHLQQRIAHHGLRCHRRTNIARMASARLRLLSLNEERGF